MSSESPGFQVLLEMPPCCISLTIVLSHNSFVRGISTTSMVASLGYCFGLIFECYRTLPLLSFLIPVGRSWPLHLLIHIGLLRSEELAAYSVLLEIILGIS